MSMTLTLYDLVIGLHTTLTMPDPQGGFQCFESDLGIMDTTDDSAFVNYRFPEGLFETGGTHYDDLDAFNADIAEKLQSANEPLWVGVANIDEAKAIISAAFTARSGVFVNCDHMAEHSHALLAQSFCESVGGNPLNIGRTMSVFRTEDAPVPEVAPQITATALPPETAVVRAFDEW